MFSSPVGRLCGARYTSRGASWKCEYFGGEYHGGLAFDSWDFFKKKLWDRFQLEILWVSLNKFKSWKSCLCDACNQMVGDHGSLVGVIHHSVRFTVRNLEQKRKHESFQQSESSQPVQWVLYQVGFLLPFILGDPGLVQPSAQAPWFPASLYPHGVSAHSAQQIWWQYCLAEFGT